MKEWLRRFLEWCKRLLFLDLEGEEVADGFPTFVITKNNKRYEPGDHLVLKEYDEEVEALTGRTVRTSINCIEDGNEGLKPGYCVLGIEAD